MKKLLLLLLSLPFLVQGQKNDTIVLSSMDSSILSSINRQGLKLFKKSDCYNKNESYFGIPEFFVYSDVPLENLEFDDSENLLSNLYFNRSSKKKLIAEIYWNVFLNRNSYVQFRSDFKKFYCYTSDSRFVNSVDSDILDLKELNYIFQLYFVDGFITFLVDKNRNIFVHFFREKKLMTLSEFNDLYKKGDIERFTSNPFQGPH